MKKIKELKIKTTYTVVLCDIEVSDEVYEILSECYDYGGDVSPNSMNNEEEIAANWLNDKIQESDAMDWEYEIEDFQD